MNVVFSGHGAGHFSGSTNAGGAGTSNLAQDQDQFDNRSLWRDNVSSSSSNVQVRGGNEWIFTFIFFNISSFTQFVHKKLCLTCMFTLF